MKVRVRVRVRVGSIGRGMLRLCNTIGRVKG